MLHADCRVKIEMDDYGEGVCGVASEFLVRGRTQREPAAVEKDDFSRIVRSADCPWPPQDGDRHGGAFLTSSPVSIKKPRYTGKADWEAFHAQFELLADAAGWSVKVKALQLAMCLADDTLSCLLLLSPEDRGDYVALVGALRRRFGLFVKPGLMRSELCNRRRKPGETLRALTNDIESLSRRAYAHMPPAVQSELARDQFLQALSPTELRMQTQLAHPQTLQEALEMAIERELVWAGAIDGHPAPQPMVRSARERSEDSQKPAWVDELTELVRAVSMQADRRPPSRREQRVCWGCGQPGHLVRECPTTVRAQGNGSGSA